MIVFEEIIADRVEIPVRQVKNTIELLEEGATIPFISRYRKEHTGSLDEVKITEIRDELNKLKELGLVVITPENPKERGSLIAIEIENADGVRKYLADNKILVSGTASENFLRIDIHFFNTEKEIDHLVETLANCLSIPIKRRKKWSFF